MGESLQLNLDATPARSREPDPLSGAACPVQLWPSTMAARHQPSETTLRMIPAGQTRPAPHCDRGTYRTARVGAAPLCSVWQRSLLARGWALSALLSLLAACSSASDDPLAGPLSDTSSASSDGPVLEAGCSEGQTESCALTLGEHDGMLSCYEGTRSCRAGVFGACENGHGFTLERSAVNQGPGPHLASPPGASLRPLSLSNATDCLNNPCNRYCREFNELPPAGVTADPDPMATPLSIWSAGSLSDYAPEWLGAGLQEPCQKASDCQFNTSCTDPALGSCSHSLCTVGSPLVPGCNRCADQVCALNADCCGTQPACVHDPCDIGTGAPLDKKCDPCVTAVCNAHPECCADTGSWNDACVGYVASECAPLGQTCGCPAGGVEVGDHCVFADPRKRLDFNTAAFACEQLGGSWQLIQVDDAAENAAAQTLIGDAGVNRGWLGGFSPGSEQWLWRATGALFFQNDASGGTLQGGFSYANWAAGKPDLGVAGDGIAISPNGEWDNEAPDSLLIYVCEGPHSFLTPRGDTFSWSPACVDLAASTCGGQCPSGIPLGLGACVDRLPTDLDAGCPGFDLALGATCEDSGKPMIPVCNHGRSATPAGLRLSFLPASEFGSATPDLTGAGDCSLTESIPPGRCLVVSDCPGLTPDMALVVNPGGPGQNSSECRLDDNWSAYQAFSCVAPTCEAGTYSMRQVQTADCSVPLRNPLGIDATQAEVSIQPEIPERHCAPGEQLWGNSCYYYAEDHGDDPETWDRAETLCERRGSGWTLVALNSEAENLWVRSSTNPGRDVQIGLNDKRLEAQHEWSNGSCVAWTNWDLANSEPNDFPPGSDQCARMTAASAERWADTDCDNFQAPYVCEGPVQEAQGACASGELMGPDGNCYVFAPTPVDAADASAVCSGHGPGWDLAKIESLQVNDFLTGLITCTPSWIAGVDPALPGGVLPLGAPFIDELGKWQGATDSEQRATLCQGPATPPRPRTLSLVADAAACTPGADEFYFAGGPVAPEALRLCPDTCTSASSLPGSRLDLAVPCAPPGNPVQATTYTQTYTSDCDGGSVIWDFLYYDAVTPADSRIEFEMRTAPTAAELAANTIAFTPVAQAHAIPTDTQHCEVNPPGCPIDIFAKLGTPSQQYKELELRVKLIPGTSGEGPLLRDWRVRYSCPPSQ
jgi:hypothetical protein